MTTDRAAGSIGEAGERHGSTPGAMDGTAGGPMANGTLDSDASPPSSALPNEGPVTGGLDRGVRDALLAVLVTGGLATAFGALAFGSRMAVSIAIGVVLAASNLWALGRILGRVLRRAWAAGADDGPSTSAAGWAFLAILKMAVLFGGAWLLMVRGLVDPIGLVVGYGAMPLGIAVSALLGPAPRT